MKKEFKSNAEKKRYDSLKYKLTCPNKKCRYMIEVGKDITAHLHKVLKRCPVCKTKYEKSDIPFHKIRLTKKQRLDVRKQILKGCEYRKRRNLIIMFFIFLYKTIKPVFYFLKIKLIAFKNKLFRRIKK